MVAKMNLDKMKNLISEWFKLTGGGSMKLPDGWFGRPLDNTHELTRLETDVSNLLIGLDDHLLLTFKHPRRVRIKEGRGDSTLSIKGFKELLFDWEEYGSSGRFHSDRYEGGAVEFVALTRDFNNM